MLHIAFSLMLTIFELCCVLTSTDAFRVFVLQDEDDAREEAEGLVGKCLLQAVGGSGYRVHDLVLEFLKTSIRAENEVVEQATALQARFLGRLDVLASYRDLEHGARHQGLFFLDALWRSVEKLSGDPDLEVASYHASLEELEPCEATEDGEISYGRVGFLFNIQVRRIFCFGDYSMFVLCSLCSEYDAATLYITRLAAYIVWSAISFATLSQ